MVNRTIPDNGVDPRPEGRGTLKSGQVQVDVQPRLLHHIIGLGR
jgi:hypothetical protein